jgi:hypothetical protein
MACIDLQQRSLYGISLVAGFCFKTKCWGRGRGCGAHAGWHQPQPPPAPAKSSNAAGQTTQRCLCGALGRVEAGTAGGGKGFALTGRMGMCSG